MHDKAFPGGHVSYDVIAWYGAAASSVVYNETLTALYRDWTSSLDLFLPLQLRPTSPKGSTHTPSCASTNGQPRDSDIQLPSLIGPNPTFPFLWWTFPLKSTSFL